METINDNLSEIDKISWVMQHLKGTAAEWYMIAQDSITTYKDLVKHFRAMKKYNRSYVCNWNSVNIPK